MGNQQQRNYSVLQMPQGNWKDCGKTDHCSLIKNQETGQEAEVYRVGIMDSNMLQDELEMYQYRKTNQTKLVKVLNVQKASSKGLCSGTDSYRVITERIPTRLGQVNDLQLPEALHVLKESLDGFELIYPSIERPIQITKDMIGFTPEGKVKVWVNTNFAVNLPNRESYIKLEAYHSDESEMPRRLFSLIEDHMQAGEFPEQLKQRIANQQNNTLSFSRMKTIIRNFCIDNDIPFLQKLNLFQNEEEEEDQDQRVTIIQETRIQSKPPAEIQQALRNNSVVKPMVVNRDKREDEDETKDRALPHSGFHQQLNFHANPPQIIPSQLAYQVNFPINAPQAQQQHINNIPVESLNFTNSPNQLIRQNSIPPKLPVQYVVGNPVRNYEEAITYEERPSNNGERVVANNQSVFSGLQNSVAVARQGIQPSINYNSQQLLPQHHNNFHGNQQKFERVYLNNNVAHLNPQHQIEANQNHHKIISHPQQFSSVNFIPHPNHVSPVNGNLTSNIPYRPSQNFANDPHNTLESRNDLSPFHTPNMSSRNLSPVRTQIPPHTQLSFSNNVPKFQMNNTPNRFQGTPINSKNGFEFSTSAKKYQFIPSNNLHDLNKPLFPESPQYVAQPSSKSFGDDLLKRMEELTNNVKNTIDQVEAEHRGNNFIPGEIVNRQFGPRDNQMNGRMDIRNYSKQRIRTFN